jgi:2-phosphosulfolactate phosphatase
MTVNIYDPSADPSLIRGFTIVVDVFRAFSTAYHINECRPERYIISEEIDHSFLLREKYDSAVLIGERDGIKLDGFDYGNSPTEISGLDFTGKTVVHNTSAGTKGVMRQPRENEVVVGSFVNGGAMLSYIRSQNIKTVNIYCTAPRGNAYGVEDYIFADYFKALLLDEPADFPAIVCELRQGSGKGFKKDGFAPYTDFLHCMDINRFNVILARKLVNEPHHSVELVEQDIS